MSYKFSLNIPWLKGAFPPSEVPRSFPGEMEETSRFTSDLYGGGFSVPETTEWFSAVNLTKTADAQQFLLSVMPLGKLTRLLAVGVAQAAAGAQVVPMTGILYVGDRLPYTISAPLCDNSANFGVGTNSPLVVERIKLVQPIILPGEPAALYWTFFTGDNRAYRFTFFFATVPRGTSFFF